MKKLIMVIVIMLSGQVAMAATEMSFETYSVETPVQQLPASRMDAESGLIAPERYEWRVWGLYRGNGEKMELRRF